MQQSKIFVGMVLILIFAEVLGLYGYAPFGTWILTTSRVADIIRRLIVALILNTRATG